MKKTLLLMMGALVMCSCKNESKTAKDSDNMKGTTVQKNERMAGGWYEAAHEGDVQLALEFAVSEISPNSGVKEILSAKKQVVKGLNYDLTFLLDNGETWNALVYRDLDGTFSLTEKSKTSTPGH
jgi:thiamine biosynthesis lipoprotein ApbE